MMGAAEQNKKMAEHISVDGNALQKRKVGLEKATWPTSWRGEREREREREREILPEGSDWEGCWLDEGRRQMKVGWSQGTPGGGGCLGLFSHVTSSEMVHGWSTF